MRLEINYRGKKKYQLGISLAVQWLGLRASNAGGTGSIPGRGKITHTAQHSQKQQQQQHKKIKIPIKSESLGDELQALVTFQLPPANPVRTSDLIA